MAKGKFGELVINSLSPVLETIVAGKLQELLDDLAVKSPEAHKTVCISLYGPIDVHLETLTAKSKTKIDDAVVNGIKTAIEESALANNVELPQLDQD